MDDIVENQIPPEEAQSPMAPPPESIFTLQPRHFDMALAEQAVHRARGRHLSVEEILKRNGFRHDDDKNAEARNNKGTRSDLNMQNLRLYVPSSVQAAMGICLLELKDGVLRIAVGEKFGDEEAARVIEALKRGNCIVTRIEMEPWDRAELGRLMREQTEVASERLVRIFATLSRDPDNGTLVEQAVHDILAEALQSRTSDIHLTLQDDDTRCWIRYRVDGDVMYKHLIPNRVMAPIVTRIKTESKMDAADRHHPQDGRLSFEWQGRMIDIRCASLPVAPSGEKLTLRLLDRDNLRSFDELFSNAPQVAQRLRRTVHGHVKDGGLIVVSGPTGSGKSTTLYGIIQEIDRSAKAVYSVEAPVEYDMPLVDQTSVTDYSKNTIADMIRALMRHDPDIIIVGEMRDSDTVEAALRATESGHLVITTVHAVDALHVLDRMDGFLSSAYRTSGLYILGHALIGSLSQRLVKTICPACHRKMPALEVYGDEMRCQDIGLATDDLLAVADRKGCDLCNHTGFLGRTLALEALFPPEDQASRRALTEMIISNVTSSITDIPGTIFIPREQSIRDLVKRRVIDAHMGASLLVEEIASKAGRR
jgi:type II secretory ATPase GspE/PulE/Tfp pilus assembly ATPase PilB-like protein